ncbi:MULTISPECIES: alpha-amylase family glycosyl hydrolase [unclassified Arcicella]|uniref:alpha-amylase family glycosyl hydrolase n=1 Tax=unclassified Arcicella TaxID=2644986 RepID=UPI00285546C9|nr:MULTISPECIES: alpha-amylase family glycosyl hydrolase [unclassified Arcicella]MDR6563149.1 1,4-alpha-glucan branching enzyme [Arcicella sp. BE51]MDR6811700.1 1,4-alpha-glucan branching enzyme [Arcicella sp. BE140]MDR6823225.1 1,4-alpha-glucan branching enzyme [Arcicella sp. BE139]
MKKIILLFTLCWVTSLCSLAQVVTTTPALPNGDQDVTLIFDLKLAKDSRAKALLGKTSDVYLWSGAGTTDTGDAFQYQPSGQTNFALPFDKGKMTSLGNDVWSIKLKPRDYFAVPPALTIKRLGVLLKSGDGKAQTEDIIVTMYDTKLNVAFIKPQEKSFFVTAGSTIPILAVASKKATLNLSINNTNVLTMIDKDSLTYSLNVGNAAGETQSVKFTATTTSETSTTEFNITVKPTPKTEALPIGLKNGINYISDTKVALVLFAPKKDFVYLIGDFNQWKTDAKYLMKRTPDGNTYWLEVEGLNKGEEYAFQYLVNGTLAVGDPYAEKILDPNNDQYISSTTYPNLKKLPDAVKSIASVFQTGQSAYPWKTTTFKRPAQDNLIVYELHIRDFDTDGSYKNAINRIPYLKTLGINCIELMPINEFSGNDSWGYNPIYYFAPDKAYGTKEDLKKFIDTCHENGIAVVLDIVFNQADYEFPYVKMYWDGTQPSTDSPFFNQQATHPFSVFFDFNHESNSTKEYVNRANEFWLKEYKIDGYRVDLAKGFTQKSSSNDSQFRLYDQSRVDIIKGYYDNIRSFDKDAYFILELFSEDKEEQTFTDLGMMVWTNLNGDFRNAVKGNASDFTRLSYKAHGFKNAGAIGYMESHDEERVAYDALKNSKAIFSVATVMERTKAAAAMFFAIPGPKMIWQFGELGYDVSIDQNGRTGKKPIHWEYKDDADRLKLYKVFSELIKLKTTQAIFKTTDTQTDLANTVKKIILNSTNQQVIIVGNFDLEQKTITDIFPNTGKWYDFFTNTEINVSDLKAKYPFAPGQFHVLSTTAFPQPEANLVPWKLEQERVLASEQELEADIKIYPNPSDEIINIEVSGNQKGNLVFKIHDLMGRTVFEIEQSDANKPHTIDIRKFQQGIYLLNVTQGQKQFNQKFIKK